VTRMRRVAGEGPRLAVYAALRAVRARAGRGGRVESDVFVRAWSRLPRLRVRSRFLHWLITIAFNAAQRRLSAAAHPGPPRESGSRGPIGSLRSRRSYVPMPRRSP